MEKGGRRVPWASLVVLLAANAWPLAGVAWLGWDLSAVMVLFWLENGIIGAYHFVKMLLAEQGKKAAMAVFFGLHYGIFWVGHGVFVLIFFVIGIGPTEGLVRAGGIGHLLVTVVAPFFILVASHGFSFLWNFVRVERRHATHDRLFWQPYPRVVALHLALIAGGFLIASNEGGASALVLLVVVKSVIDAIAHARQHMGLPPSPDSPAPAPETP